MDLSPRSGAGDALRGLPRRGLWAALRRAAPAVPDREPGAARSGPGPLWEQEEEWGGAGAGFPPDLFGPGFLWEPPSGPAGVFLDLETCGLGDEPIFLLGVLRPAGESLRLRTVLARDLSAEPALLRRAAELLGAATWISFNGRSFDAPRLHRRSALHRIELPRPAEHLDLLLEVRRRFRGELPNCRLSTVERRLLRLERSGDEVSGREVPERYREFTRTGDPGRIAPVVEHNRRDLTAMAVLYRRLGR